MMIFKVAIALLFLGFIAGRSMATETVLKNDTKSCKILSAWGTSGSLYAQFSSKRLVAKSVQESDIPFLKRLYGDKTVMQRFGDGRPKAGKSVEQWIRSSWIDRWQNGDPRGGFVVLSKESSYQPIGVVVAGKGDQPGESEIAYLLVPQYQGKGYGVEIVSALVFSFVPWVKKNFEDLFDGESLNQLFATVSPDNIGSWKILDKLGFKTYDESLEVMFDPRNKDHLRSQLIPELPDNVMFNMFDSNGIIRSAKKHSDYKVLKWYLKLEVE